MKPTHHNFLVTVKALSDQFFQARLRWLAVVAGSGLVLGNRMSDGWLTPAGPDQGPLEQHQPCGWLGGGIQLQSESFGPSGRAGVSEAAVLQPSSGWKWLIEPAKPPPLPDEVKWVTVFGVAGRNDRDPNRWRLSAGQLQLCVDAGPEDLVQVVCIYPDGQRELVDRTAQDPRSRTFPLPLSVRNQGGNILLGVQSAGPGEQAALMARAREEAAKSGIRILPPADLGAPFQFELTATDGAYLSQAMFKGKVVVIFEWATWCRSCHELMPEIFDLARRHPDQVALIGICHDGLETVSKAGAEMGRFPAGCRNVLLASLGQKAPKLWALSNTGGTSYGIPVVWLVDPDGVLEARETTRNIIPRIEELLEKSKEGGNSAKQSIIP